MAESNETPDLNNEHYQRAQRTVEQTIQKLSKCSDAERAKLEGEFKRLRGMLEKLSQGQVEIVVFGEISTGKSAMINALVGEDYELIPVYWGDLGADDTYLHSVIGRHP